MAAWNETVEHHLAFLLIHKAISIFLVSRYFLFPVTRCSKNRWGQRWLLIIWLYQYSFKSSYLQQMNSYSETILETILYSWYFSRYLNSTNFTDMGRFMKFKSLKNHSVYVRLRWFMKIKMQKYWIVEFKYFEKYQLYGK